MSSRAAQLAIELAEHGADDVVSALSRVTDAAGDMGDTVDRAARQADDSSGRLNRAAEASDNLASKSSQATGGLGALASGMELVGLGPYAAGLQAAAMATDFFSGVGDIANLVLESQAVASARAKVAMVAQAVTTRASAVAQRALNLAMEANPVLLVVAGVTLLVAAFVLAYKRSATFRDIVNSGMGVARAAVGKLVGGVEEAVGVFGDVEHAAERSIGWITSHAADVGDKFADAWGRVKRVGIDAIDAVTQPVRDLVDLVQGLIDKIASIHLPHLPHIGNPFGRTGNVTDTGSASSGDQVTIYVTVAPTPGTSAADAGTQAQATMDAIDARLRAVGRRPVFVR